MSKFNFNKMAAAHDTVMLMAMQRIARETRQYALDNFRRQTWGRTPWAALSPNTRVATQSNPILIVTAELFRTVHESIKSVTPNKVIMEIDAVDDRGRHYSNYHNEGTSEMPARPVLKQNDEMTQMQLRILRMETGRIWYIN